MQIYNHIGIEENHFIEFLFILPTIFVPTAKHTATVARTTELLKAADTNAKQWLELANETFQEFIDLGDVFTMANDEEQR